MKSTAWPISSPTNSFGRWTCAAASMSLLLACGTRSDATHDSAAGTVAMTDSTGVTTTMSGAASSTMDASMTATVITVNLGEIEEGKLAATKARNGEIRDFARDMVDAHEQALHELEALGSKYGWTIPDSTGVMPTLNTSAMATTIASLEQVHQSTMTTLRAATGSSFDRSYIDGQVTAHQQALELLRQHNASLQNGELRDKLTAMEKVVDDHLRRAQTLSQRLSAASR